MNDPFLRGLVRSLVTSEKVTRDKTVDELKKFIISRKSFDNLEMEKLWKGLYYCMWLSDKAEIQEELSLTLAKITHCFPSMDGSLQYIRVFFRTMLKEWGMLDKHRIDKFYYLIRVFIREIFIVVKDSSWDRDLVRSINTVLMDEVLTKTPGGVRSQVVDVFIPELHKISNTITTDSFMLLIEPFIELLNTTYEPNLMVRVQKQVFRKLLETITGKDDPMELENEENDNSENNNDAFPNINALYLQRFIFDMASDPDLKCEKNRGSLYDIHRVFQKFNRTEMVSNETLIEIEKSMAANTKNNKIKSKTKKEKKTQQQANEAMKEKESSSSSSSKKRKEVEASMDIDDIIDMRKDKERKEKKEKKQKREDKEQEQEKRSSLSQQSSSSSSSSDSIVDWTNADSVSQLPKYIPAKSYAGRKHGFVFKKGSKGLGYYQDGREVKYAKVAAKNGLLKSKSKTKTPDSKDKSRSKSSDKKKSNVSSNMDSSDTSPRVSFGKDHAKSYDDSVKGLKVSSPDSDASPDKGVLKIAKREKEKEKKVKSSKKEKDSKKSKKRKA